MKKEQCQPLHRNEYERIINAYIAIEYSKKVSVCTSVGWSIFVASRIMYAALNEQWIWWLWCRICVCLSAKDVCTGIWEIQQAKPFEEQKGDVKVDVLLNSYDIRLIICVTWCLVPLWIHCVAYVFTEALINDWKLRRKLNSAAIGFIIYKKF